MYILCVQVPMLPPNLFTIQFKFGIQRFWSSVLMYEDMRSLHVFKYHQ